MRPLLLLATTLFPFCAAAQDAPPVAARPAGPGQPAATVIAEPVAMMIAAFDSDGDARVTRAEFDAGLRRSFDAVDTRRAGTLGYIAFSDWSERWLGDRNTLPSPFETDRDGDNKISFAELAARFDMLWTRFDKNADGAIVRSELVSIRPQMPDPRGDRRRRQGSEAQGARTPGN